MGSDRVLVQMRWPRVLRDRVDVVAGSRGRTAFVLGALEAALADREPNASTVVPVAASPRAPLPSLSEAVEKAGLNRFRCGCVTSATSSSAKCPKHGRLLA